VSIVSIAVRNILRTKFRTVFTIVGAAVALIAFVVLQTVLTSWSAAADYSAQDRLATRQKNSLITPLPKRYVEEIRQIPGVSAATFATWFGGRDMRHPNDSFPSFAVDDSALSVFTEYEIKPEERARWLEDRQGALIGDVLARRLGVAVGDRITLTGTAYPGEWQFNVSAIYTSVNKGVDRARFFLHWSYLNDSMPDNRKDQVGWILSRIDDPSRGAEISAAIDRKFSDRDMQTTTMSERALNLSSLGMVSAILSSLSIASVVILGIMMLLLGNTIAMTMRERSVEFSILRAIGFLPRHVALLVLSEALTIGALAGAVGVGLAYPFVHLGMSRWIEENMTTFFPSFQITTTTTILALVIPIALAGVAGLIPMRRAMKVTVSQGLRNLG
jgi:putative ABC transport system permease protein